MLRWRNVTGGRLEQTVKITSDDEMGRLASTFNAMTKELADSREKMENWTRSLEEGIAKKTEELKKSQDRLIQAEKLASLGRLTADVAHEIQEPPYSAGGLRPQTAQDRRRRQRKGICRDRLNRGGQT